MVIAAALVLAAPAAALVAPGDAVDNAARALESSPVYVDPGASNELSQADARRIAAEIDRRNAGPMYVAVLPASAADAAGGDAAAVLSQIHDRLQRPGVYAGIVGNHFRAGATGGVLPQGEAGQLATEAFNAHQGDGPAAVLLDFVDRVAAAKRGGGASGGGGSNDNAPSGTGLLILLGVLAAGGGLFALVRSRRRRQELAEVKRVARDDLVELGDEIRALDIDVSMPNANRDAKVHYNAAVDVYQRAEQIFDRARRPEDLEPVASEMEHGRYEMQATRALLEGRPVPERRPPCFFDPRHGPSERDVEWAPPGGVPRPVPACAADAQRVEQGLDPNVREIQYGGQMLPYWAAPAAYTPFFGGFYGGFGMGGFLPGLLIGEMLGGGFGGWGEPVYSDSGWGGGDFGGGDFGGGGFGDFGGGDFGGGGGDF